MSNAPILVVDDSEDAQEFLTGTLVQAGYEVMQARNGRDALALVLDHPSPKLVIVDLLMPVMDGAELIDVLHCYKRLAQIPVLIVSATEIPESQRPRAARYLKKPFGEQELLAEIGELLRG
jgi:chemotaxis family two-component system sensor histidine kinase/response regulator PixL